MNFITTTTLSLTQKEDINRIWNAEYPTALLHPTLSDFEGFLNKQTDHKHILAINPEGKINGWFISFGRDGENWFSILVDHSAQGQGIGGQLLTLAKEGCSVLNGWVIDQDDKPKSDGSYYKSPMEFYLKNNLLFYMTYVWKLKYCQPLK